MSLHTKYESTCPYDKKKSYAQDKLYNNNIIYNKSEGIGS